MSRIALTETTGRTNYVDSAWTDDDKALFNTLDNSGVLLTYAQKMAIYNWGLSIKATATGGLQSVSIDVDVSTEGPTYTITGATTSILVIRNGVPLQNQFTFNTGTGTWSFTDPLITGDKLTFIYS